MNRSVASFSPARSKTCGFSLIELLVVIALIAGMMALAGPAVNAMKGASTLTKSSEDMKGVFEQARAHAMAKNTYVYIGLVELDDMATGNVSKSQGGRIGAVVLASKTGVRPVLSGSEINTDSISPVSRLIKMDNVILKTISADLLGRQPGAKDISTEADLVTLKWPASGNNQLTYEKVIEFDSQGVARLAKPGLFSNQSAIDGYVEIPLKQARGGDANVRAVQVDGITGAVRIYRP